MGQAILFWFEVAVALVSAVVVVTHRNPVYSVMSLVITLVSLAAMFVMLAGHLLGVLLVLVYAGAILVLFLFVIMLLNVGQEPRGLPRGRLQRWGAVAGAALFGGALFALQQGALAPPRLPITPEDVSLKPIARMLFGEYLLVFEMTGLLLLAAVIAATVLARRPEPKPEAADAGGES
jgi:NADH-quinone oxidoreductase subunit J